MSMWNSKELLAKELSCPICLRLFTEPVMLPCGHNYCLACIQKVVVSENVQNLCPECRQEFRGSEALQRNVKLCSIVHSYQASLEETSKGDVVCDLCMENRTPAIKTCLKCEVSLCPQHLHRHSIKYSFSNHILMEPQSDLSWKTCSVHNKVLEFFCTTDASVLCSSCFIEGTHQNHDIQNFESAEAEIRRILQSQVKLASNKLKMTESLLQRSMEDKKVFTSTSTKLEARSMTLLSSILQQANGYKAHLSVELQEMQRGQEEGWQSDMNHILMQQASLKDVQEQVASILKETDTCLFVQRYLWIKGQLTETLESDVNMLPPPVLDVKQLCAAVRTDEFREEMNRLLQSLHTLLNPLELTFDPNTVHPNLLLSNDLKTAKYSTKRQTYPEHPERFQTAPQVLCAQGFSGGEHVWVVELGPGAWSVGLCYHSMVRKGDSSRLGHNAASWRLQWKNKKLTACNGSNSVSLPDTLPPMRLEVTLDYSAGTLCFHSTMGRREHLHTFRTTFQETVYPAFSIHSTTSESWITLQN